MILETYSTVTHTAPSSAARARPTLSPEAARRMLDRLDTWAAFAVVVLGSSSTLCAGAWMLARWQLL